MSSASGLTTSAAKSEMQETSHIDSLTFRGNAASERPSTSCSIGADASHHNCLEI